jgi:carboxylate-amine ligase
MRMLTSCTPPATSARTTLVSSSTAPRWARWNGERDQPYTVGVEEELMLLDPVNWSLSQSSDRVLPRLSRPLAARASPETHAAVLELSTAVHRDVEGVVGELAVLRHRLAAELQEMGLAVAAAGTHPLTVSDETAVSAAPRYRLLQESMRLLVRREPTMALHVHVGVPGADDAVRVLNALRRNVPLLLALAANSPFWQGRDAGFVSTRTLIFQAFPRTGPPRVFADYADYVEAVDALIASTAIPDPTFLWWDVRLQPALGTVETRVMDAQSTLPDVAPLVALIQSLARLELEGDAPPSVPSAEVLAENRFLAARDGMQARLIDAAGRRLIAARELLDGVVGCAASLDRVMPLADANGAEWQRAVVRRGEPLDRVVAGLADRFLESNPTERSG